MFGIIVLFLMSWLIHRGGSVDEITRSFGIVLVLFSSAFLVAAGADSKDIAPVIGLLGTVAGFLMGRKTPP